jgi:putative redox protein
MSTVHVKWIESQLMVGADSNGHALAISNSSEREPAWWGVRPADMLLLAAASCSLYDVIDILQKQREPLQDVEVTCHGEKESEPIYRFKSIHLHYAAKGKIDPQKLEKAIGLSIDKYCTVINTLKACATVTYDYEIVES